MESLEVIKRVNENRNQIEASFVFGLWREPELFDGYKFVNDNKDTTLRDPDAIFYYNLGRAMYKAGYRNFDSLTLYTFLQNKEAVQKQFDEFGGYKTVESLMNLVSTENVEANFDRLAKINTLDAIVKLYENSFSDMAGFEGMNSQDIYDYLSYQLGNISIHAKHDINEESLILDDEFYNTCNSGKVMGISYSKNCPLLNYLTLGVPLGNMYMLASHSGVGKSSFIFENMALPMNDNGIKVAIISNEMRSDDYKVMLLEHILTKELNYWGLTRKQIKIGNFTEEQSDYFRKAQAISREKFNNIKFIQLFDNDVNKVLKYISRSAKLDYKVFFWDTMKSDDTLDQKMFIQLLINSRKVFQTCSKENIALVTTYQLALHTVNQRYLDAGCLANGKQIKEVFSEMVYMRTLWDDEYNGCKFDCHPYQLVKGDNGRHNVKQEVTLDPNKKYIIVFLDKTRNDEDKQQIIYEVNGRFNNWKELGYCHIINERGR